MVTRRRALVPLLMLALFSPSLYGQESGLYRSNDRFLPIEEIGENERGSYRWVLELSLSNGRSEGVLYREGELFRRKVESFTSRGVPREVRILDAAGELLERWTYRYDPSGRLRAIEVEGEDRESRFQSGRSLRGPGSEEESLFTAEDELRTLYSYDASGRLTSRFTYRSGELIERVVNEYEGETLIRRVRAYPQERRRVTTTFDAAGNPVVEEAYEAGRLVSTTERSYDDEGRLLILEVSGRQPREVRYEYDEQGDPILEQEYRAGALLRRITYEGDQRVETRFRAGQPVLRTYFDGDVRIREELLQNGEVIDVRRF